VKPLAELFDVRRVQLAFAGKHFGDDALTAQLRGQIALLQAVLVEQNRSTPAGEALGTE